jgi:hypothetical protein
MIACTPHLKKLMERYGRKVYSAGTASSEFSPAASLRMES